MVVSRVQVLSAQGRYGTELLIFSVSLCMLGFILKHRTFGSSF